MQDPRGTPYPARWQLSRRCKSTLTELEDPYCTPRWISCAGGVRAGDGLFLLRTPDLANSVHRHHPLSGRVGHLALPAKAWQHVSSGEVNATLRNKGARTYSAPYNVLPCFRKACEQRARGMRRLSVAGSMAREVVGKGG